MQGSTFSAVISYVLNLAYPATCPVCETQATEHTISPLCNKCWDVIKKQKRYPRCKVCSKLLLSFGAHTCLECMASPPAYEASYCYGPYDGPIVSAIHTLKYKGTRRLAGPLGELLCSVDIKTHEIDAVVPVPMTKGALLQRGFNQTALLGEKLAEKLGIPLWLDALVKTRETAQQVGLSRVQRAQNVKGAFLATSKVNGKGVIIVDDVITTASTMRECARALKRAGAGRIIAVALARAHE